MTATTQPQPTSPSRRALLAGAVGGIGALVASALGRAPSVRAANGDPVLLGNGNTATGPTTVTNTTTGLKALEGVATGAGIGVRGESTSGPGVRGSATSGNGVSGGSASGIGVYGESDSQAGVFGASVTGTGAVGDSTSGMGVIGHSTAAGYAGSAGFSEGNSTGVFGYSGTTSVPPAAARTGVYGYANQSSSAKGIYGKSSKGFAGYFAGKVYLSRFQEMREMSTPPAPGINKARLFVRDDGAGKTQLCVRFNTGAIRVLATQA